MGRISIAHLAAAINKVRAMDMAQRVSLAEEISAAEPHMLASCLVQTRLGLDASAVDILLNILLVCYQAMKESGLQWPLISEDEQERQLRRLTGAVLFSEKMTDPRSLIRPGANTCATTRSSRCSPTSSMKLTTGLPT
jgi:hypothetical protein